jgi:flagellar hook-length control protein FliK
MVLEVVKEGNSVVVLMKVETQEAKEMLEKNAHLLTQRLAQTGFEAQKIQVTMEKYEEQGQGQQDAQKERSSDQERQQKENENTKENNNDEPVYQSFAELLAGI